MKISIENLDKARTLAGQRLHLEKEREKLSCGAPLTFANAKVVFTPITAARGKAPEVCVEIEEGSRGEIGQAILECIIRNIDMRIELLDEKLGALGIEVEP